MDMSTHWLSILSHRRSYVQKCDYTHWITKASMDDSYQPHENVIFNFQQVLKPNLKSTLPIPTPTTRLAMMVL